MLSSAHSHDKCEFCDQIENRLRLAEAVVEAHQAFENHMIDHKCDADMCDTALALGNIHTKALAAWEEGTE